MQQQTLRVTIEYVAIIVCSCGNKICYVATEELLKKKHTQ